MDWRWLWISNSASESVRGRAYIRAQVAPQQVRQRLDADRGRVVCDLGLARKRNAVNVLERPRLGVLAQRVELARALLDAAAQFDNVGDQLLPRGRVLGRLVRLGTLWRGGPMSRWSE